jgi:hypothetical protein
MATSVAYGKLRVTVGVQPVEADYNRPSPFLEYELLQMMRLSSQDRKREKAESHECKSSFEKPGKVVGP